MVYILIAFSLDLSGFGVYTFPAGAAGAMSFHDPLEDTEIEYRFIFYRRQRTAAPLHLSGVGYLSPRQGALPGGGAFTGRFFEHGDNGDKCRFTRAPCLGDR